MGGMRTSDIIVVGNGVIGLSIALQLARTDPTASIAIIGEPATSNSASLAAGAMLGSFGEITNSSFSSPAGIAKFKMSRMASALWPEWLEYVSSSTDQLVTINDGTFVFTNCRSGTLEDQNFQAIIRALEHHQEPYDVVDPREAKFLLPEDDSRATNLIYIPREGSIDGSAHILSLNRKVAMIHAINFIHGTAEGIDVKSSRVIGVKLKEGETIYSKNVIVANGVRAGILLQSVEELIDAVPPMFAGMGTSLIVSQPLETIRHVIRTPNRAFACGFHAVPRSGYELYLGATNNIHLEAVSHPTMSDIHFLMECAMEQLNHRLHAADVFATKVGNRPITLDTYPMLGPTRIKGLFVATGTYRDGFHLSPMIAAMLSDLVLTEKPSEGFDMFGAHRNYIQPMSTKEAIEQTISYYLAVGSEHALNIPKVGWHEMLHDYFREKVSSLYAELDSDAVLHPDFFSIIDQNRETMIPLFRNYLQKANFLKAQNQC